MVLQHVQQQRAELMIASHNEKSVLEVARRMAELGIDPARA